MLKRKVIFTCLLSLILTLSLTGCIREDNKAERENMGQKAVEFMKEFYDMEVGVKTVSYSWNTKTYSIEVYLEEMPSLVFDLYGTADGRLGAALIVEPYMTYKFTKDHVYEEVKEIFDEGRLEPRFDMSIDLVNGDFEKHDTYLDGIEEEYRRTQDIELDKRLGENPENFLFNTYFHYYIDITEANKAEVAREILQYLEYLKSFGLTGGNIRVYFFDPAIQEEVDLDEMYRTKGHHSTEYYLRTDTNARVGALIIDKGEFDSITTLEEMINKMKIDKEKEE